MKATLSKQKHVASVASVIAIFLARIRIDFWNPIQSINFGNYYTTTFTILSFVITFQFPLILFRVKGYKPSLLAIAPRRLELGVMATHLVVVWSLIVDQGVCGQCMMGAVT